MWRQGKEKTERGREDQPHPLIMTGWDRSVPIVSNLCAALKNNHYLCTFRLSSSRCRFTCYMQWFSSAYNRYM